MKIHFIGIGGIGISALAQYYLAKGHGVSGSDLNSSETTNFLKEKGAKLLIGVHKTENIPENTDLVIYSPAVQKENTELKQALVLQATGYKLQVLSYPQALGKLTKEYFTIAVSGTHGKSTVTAMVSLILLRAGFDPTVILGTKLKEFEGSNFRMGNPSFRVVPRFVPRGSAILVIEADEWQASFLNYFPKIIILTNIEKEHLDYYKNLSHILRTFKIYLSHLPEDGFLVANKDNKNIRTLIQKFSTKSDYPIIRNIVYFSKEQEETKKLKEILKIPGKHNILNALASLKVARILKIPDKISYASLSEYQGSWRRFEIIEADIRGYQRRLTQKITIISDYAHHPTEIMATLEAVKEKYKDKKIFLIFQPHQYQRTFYLFQDFVKVFKKTLGETRDRKFVDKLIITDIFDVAGRENEKIKRTVNSKKLVKAINNPQAIHLKKSEITAFLGKNLKGGEIVVFMGAGDIYKLAEQF